jgi:hypothetical protein
MTSLNCFSQSGQDSTKIQLTRPIAEVVAKGLVRYDGQVLEISELNKQIQLYLDKISKKDEVILTLEGKVVNLQTIITKKDEQFSLERQKSESLLKELKKEKRKTFLYKLGTYVGIVATGLLFVK